jgi:hypothetical protein
MFKHRARLPQHRARAASGQRLRGEAPAECVHYRGVGLIAHTRVGNMGQRRCILRGGSRRLGVIRRVTRAYAARPAENRLTERDLPWIEGLAVAEIGD